MNFATHKAQKEATGDEAVDDARLYPGAVLVGRYRIGAPGDDTSERTAGRPVSAQDLHLHEREVWVSYVYDGRSVDPQCLVDIPHVAPLTDCLSGLQGLALVFLLPDRAASLSASASERSREANALALLGYYEALVASEGCPWSFAFADAYVSPAIDGFVLYLLPTLYPSETSASEARAAALRMWPERVGRLLYGVEPDPDTRSLERFVPDAFVPYAQRLLAWCTGEALPTLAELRRALLVEETPLRLAPPSIDAPEEGDVPEVELREALAGIQRRTWLWLALAGGLLVLALVRLAELLDTGGAG